MNLRLLDIRVIESSAFIAAPLAGLNLAQFGADVIRVDMIGGGIDYGRLPLMPTGRSLYWTGLNKGKRSIAIDLRQAAGQELVRSLVTAGAKNSGILLTNVMAPWLTHQLLAHQRPDVITCVIEGNSDGTTAVDYTVNCAAGYPAVTGQGSVEAPVNHVLPAWDIACAYQAALSIVSAVDRRRRSGQGAELRLALSDVAFTMLSHLGLTSESELLGQERTSIGNHIYGAFGRDFGTSDGKRVMIAAISSRQWTSLVKACEAEQQVEAIARAAGLDFRREADRFGGREAIATILEPWFASRKMEEVSAALDREGVCWGQYRTTRDLMANDPRVGVGNPIWERIETPGVGNHLAAGTPVRAGGEARGPVLAAPVLGQHTDEVLLDVLGLSSSEVGELHDKRVVAGPECDRSVAGT